MLELKFKLKPLVISSNLVAATKPPISTPSTQGIHQNQVVYLSTNIDQGIFITEAIKYFLLTCEREDKPYGMIALLIALPGSA